MKISDIIELAANKFLWTGVGKEPPMDTGSPTPYSCCAVSRASMHAGGEYRCEARDFVEGYLEDEERRGNFLFDLGLDLGLDCFHQLAQQVRYSWLMLLAHIAREQGL